MVMELSDGGNESTKVAFREKWRGTGVFIYYVPEASYPASTKVAKAVFGKKDVPYLAYLAMKTASGKVEPWKSSDSDKSANDWVIEDVDKFLDNCDKRQNQSYSPVHDGAPHYSYHIR